MVQAILDIVTIPDSGCVLQECGVNLCWIRNDLRLSDNPALHSAVNRGKAIARLHFRRKKWG